MAHVLRKVPIGHHSIVASIEPKPAAKPPPLSIVRDGNGLDDLAAANRARRAALEETGEEIARLSCIVGVATHRLLTCIRKFDEGSGWGDQGALSCAHWLSWRVGLGLVAAREKVRVARALGGLPLIDAALGDGQLSYSQVRALTRVATAENESALLELAKAATGSQLERICRAYRTVGTPVEEPEQFLTIRDADGGMTRVILQVTSERAARFIAGLDLHRKSVHEVERARRAAARRAELEAAATGVASRASPAGSEQPSTTTSSGDAGTEANASKGTPTNEPPSDGSSVHAGPDTGNGSGRATNTGAIAGNNPPFPFGRVDAAISLADSALAGLVQLPDGPRRPPRYEVMVVVDAHGKAGHLEDGTPIAEETIQRITCDAPLVPVLWKEGEGALDLGRRTRTVTPALERALRMRDGGCRFPGCTHYLWTEAHHIVHWSKGGETKASNLILLCDFHHRRVHEGRFSLTGDAREPVFRDRQGKVLERPPLPSGAEARRLLDRFIADEGLAGRSAPIPHWDGSPLDLGWTIASLAQAGPARGRKFN